MTERMTPEQYRRELRQPDWGSKRPMAVLDQDSGKWQFTAPPQTEQDVIDGCLHVASWLMYVPLSDLAPRGTQRLSKAEMERAVRIALEEVQHRKLAGLWYATSANARSRNALGTPDYHFVTLADGEAITKAVEFKGPGSALRVNQAILAELGASTIIGPDDLNKFAALLR